MPTDKVIDTDVLVVGGAMAGLFAAIKAREAGRNVTLIEKAQAGKSGAGLFWGNCSCFNAKQLMQP